MDEVIIACDVHQLKLSSDREHFLEVDKPGAIKDLLHALAFPENVGLVTMLVKINLLDISALLKTVLSLTDIKLDLDMLLLILPDRILVYLLL